MTRIQKYHSWHADWWERQSVTREGLSAEEAEGFAAYAFRQADIRTAMGAVCTAAWQDVEKYVSLGAQLIDEAEVDDDDETHERAALADARERRERAANADERAANAETPALNDM